MTLVETACVAIKAVVLTPQRGMVSDDSLFYLRKTLVTLSFVLCSCIANAAYVQPKTIGNVIKVSSFEGGSVEGSDQFGTC